jgi:hypothetical protein
MQQRVSKEGTHTYMVWVSTSEQTKGQRIKVHTYRAWMGTSELTKNTVRPTPMTGMLHMCVTTKHNQVRVNVYSAQVHSHAYDEESMRDVSVEEAVKGAKSSTEYLNI